MIGNVDGRQNSADTADNTHPDGANLPYGIHFNLYSDLLSLEQQI